MNKEFPTYFDIRYANSSRIFEAEEIIKSGVNPDQLNEAEQTYYKIIEALENGQEIDEGFFGALTGGVVGALAGPAIMRAICKILGIDEKGTLGKLLTSRLVTTSVGISLGS